MPHDEPRSAWRRASVAGRFVVTVSTLNVAPEQLAKLAESLPLEKLAEMK